MELKHPKYKIGDVILYKNRYEGDMVSHYQSKIIESYCYLDEEDPDDTATWFYVTEETSMNDSDSLQEDEVTTKLN